MSRFRRSVPKYTEAGYIALKQRNGYRISRARLLAYERAIAVNQAYAEAMFSIPKEADNGG